MDHDSGHRYCNGCTALFAFSRVWRKEKNPSHSREAESGIAICHNGNACSILPQGYELFKPFGLSSCASGLLHGNRALRLEAKHLSEHSGGHRLLYALGTACFLILNSPYFSIHIKEKLSQNNSRVAKQAQAGAPQGLRCTPLL